MKPVLFVHQSAELYGSDRVLLTLVEGLDRTRFEPIVALPAEGPLAAALRERGIETHVLPLALVSRASFGAGGALRLAAASASSVQALRRRFRGRGIRLVHSNTLAVLSGALWARASRLPHVWHVHEMVVRPRAARLAFAWLLRGLATRVACNSRATRDLLVSTLPSLAARCTVVHNGFDRTEAPDPEAAAALRVEAGAGPEDVVVALVGRINRWKGQGLLVEAADLLWAQGVRRIVYLIVGGTPPGQAHFRDELLRQVGASAARKAVRVLDFREDVSAVWDACDIAVVPSTEPEPFGMVALEAMAAGKPVVAANHGGLPEIVEDGQTGILVSPGSAPDLARALTELTENDELRRKMGEAGRRRLLQDFSPGAYVSGFESVYDALN